MQGFAHEKPEDQLRRGLDTYRRRELMTTAVARGLIPETMPMPRKQELILILSMGVSIASPQDVPKVEQPVLLSEAHKPQEPEIDPSVLPTEEELKGLPEARDPFAGADEILDRPDPEEVYLRLAAIPNVLALKKQFYKQFPGADKFHTKVNKAEIMSATRMILGLPSLDS